MLGLQSYLDYVLGFENEILSADFNKKQVFSKFCERICESEDREIVLVVFNLITWSQRKVNITPSREWPNSDGLLG